MNRTPADEESQDLIGNFERARMSTDREFLADGFPFDVCTDSNIQTDDGGELSGIDGDTIALQMEDFAHHVERERDRVNWDCEGIKRNEVQKVETCKFSLKGNDAAPMTAIDVSQSSSSNDTSEVAEGEPMPLECHCNGGQLFEVVDEGNFTGSILSKWKTFQCMACNVWYYFHPSDSTGFAMEGLLQNSIGEVKLQNGLLNNPSGREQEKSSVELNYSEKSKLLGDGVQIDSRARSTKNPDSITGSDQKKEVKKKVNSSSTAKRVRGPHRPYSNGIEYTERENQTIINYLIDNNAILQATGHKVWREMESKKLLVNPYRSEHGMRRHFSIHLRYNFRKYTQDENAIKQFEVLERKAEVKNYFTKLIQAIDSTSED